MKTASRNIFSVLCTSTILCTTAFGMDAPMELEKQLTTHVNKEPKLKFTPQCRTLREIENDFFIFAVAKSYCDGIKTKAYFKSQKPETVYSNYGERSYKEYDSWDHDLPTPDRRCSVYNAIDSAFSNDGSKAIFAQYSHDDELNSDHFYPLGRTPGLLVAVFDLGTKKMSQYQINGDLGQICGDFGKLIVSNNGNYCARLLKQSALQGRPASTTVIIDKLTQGIVHHYTIKVAHSLDATSISFAKDDNTELLVEGTNGNKVFKIKYHDNGCFYPTYGSAVYNTFKIGKTQAIHSIDTPQDKCGLGRVPFMGLCDATLIEKLQEVGFINMQLDDLVIYSYALHKETGLKIIPVKYFTKEKGSYALLVNGTHLYFHPNPFVKNSMSPGQFTLVLFTHNENKDMIQESARYQQIQSVIQKGYLEPTNQGNADVVLQESFTDGHLTVSKIASSYQLSEELINRMR